MSHIYPKEVLFVGKDRDSVLGLAIFLFSLFVFIISLQQGGSSVSQFGAGFFPMVLSVALGFCGLLLIWAGHARKEKLPLPNLKNKEIIVASVMSLLYCFLLGPLGFCISSILFLAAIFFFLGLRKIQHLLVLPVGLSLGLYWFFVSVLHVALP